MDCSPPGFTFHGISQAKILVCVAISLGDIPYPGIELTSPALVGGFFTIEPLGKSRFFHSVQFICSVTSNSLQLHGLQHASFPVYHQLLELAQTHVHWVSDSTQPSHCLSSPSPPTFNLRQHQGLFQWVSSSHQEAKLLELQLQCQSFQWIFSTNFL